MPLSPSELAYQQAHIHDSVQTNVIAGTAICLVAAYVSVSLRFTSRWMGQLPFGKDDISILIALASGTALSVLIFVLTAFGLGKHQITQNPDDREIVAKLTIAARVLAFFSIFTVKLSILLLYHRIFSTYRRFTAILWLIGVFVAAFNIAAILVNILACRPLKALGNPSIPQKCVNISTELGVFSVLDVLTDVLILCAPLPLVWKLQMDRKRKWQVTGMFLVGSLVCVGGIVRTVYSTRISMEDASWDNALPGMWGTIEGNLAIVSACLPTLRPLLRLVYGKRPQADSTSISHAHSNTVFSGHAQKFVKMDSDMELERLPVGKRSGTETTSEARMDGRHDGTVNPGFRGRP